MQSVFSTQQIEAEADKYPKLLQSHLTLILHIHIEDSSQLLAAVGVFFFVQGERGMFLRFSVWSFGLFWRHCVPSLVIHDNL